MRVAGALGGVSVVLALGLVAVACKGDKGAAGTPAVDSGGIAGTVKDPSGAPVAGASVSTVPSTAGATTDSSGGFALASIPIGSYEVVASKSGYVNGTLAGVGVGAGASVQVSLVLALVPPTSGSISGKIQGRSGLGTSVPVAGAQVCVEGTSACTTSAADGTYALAGVTPGFVFVSATASGYLLGETRHAVNLSAGGAVAGVDLTLSGQPPAAAGYVGSQTCLGCHTSATPQVVSDWKSSAHYRAVDRTPGSIDVTGWAPAAAGCATPSTVSPGITAADPSQTGTPQRAVFLLRYAATCTPAFAMAFDSNGDGVFDAGDLVVPVNGSIGGVATDAGQCGNGGILPSSAPCSSNLGGTGTTAAAGWWQQEYLVDIGGASKPSWVGWTTVAGDALVLPLAWNQRSRTWVAAPDYNPSQGATLDAACSGCHQTGLAFGLDASGNLTSFSAASPDIGCEKCHGPGSAHASSGDAAKIVNPRYLTAQSEREVCGQCHTNGATSASPAGLFGFPWNDKATLGGGNFIPGVHQLSDFQAAPAYGDPGFYFPSGFPSTDHLTYVDLQGSVHGNNPYDRVACSDCHASHGSAGGPVEIDASDPATGDQYAFQANAAVLQNDVLCLVCHATHGSFASIALADVANYHTSAPTGAGATTTGTVLKNGVAYAPAAGAQAASAAAVASAVTAHMMAQAGMPAYFDPTGAASGMPVGRCSSCHMAKTPFTGQYYSGPDASGRTANVIGDVSSHVFRVATPDMSLATWAAATTWDGVMPNACGSCHEAYRFGK